MFAFSGILFNHESPRRGLEFVTRKITRRRRAHQARPGGRASPRQPRRQARLGLRRRLRRGDVADAPAGRAGRLCRRDGRDAHGAGVRRDRLRARRARLEEARRHRSRFVRPAEVDLLVGDASKAREKLGWKPRVWFEELVEDDGRRRPRAPRKQRGSREQRRLAVGRRARVPAAPARTSGSSDASPARRSSSPASRTVPSPASTSSCRRGWPSGLLASHTISPSKPVPCDQLHQIADRDLRPVPRLTGSAPS